MVDNRFEVLRERLNKLTWPSGYMFKFIVPSGKVDQIIEILPTMEYKLKESGKGNYVSITSYNEMASGEEVIDVYIKAARVEGVISL